MPLCFLIGLLILLAPATAEAQHEDFLTRDEMSRIVIALGADDDEATVAWAVYDDIAGDVERADAAAGVVGGWGQRWRVHHERVQHDIALREVMYSGAIVNDALLKDYKQQKTADVFETLRAVIPLKGTLITLFQDSRWRQASFLKGIPPVHGHELVAFLLTESPEVLGGEQCRAILDSYSRAANALSREREQWAKTAQRRFQELREEGDRAALVELYKEMPRNTLRYRELLRDTVRQLQSHTIISDETCEILSDAMYSGPSPRDLARELSTRIDEGIPQEDRERITQLRARLQGDYLTWWEEYKATYEADLNAQGPQSFAERSADYALDFTLPFPYWTPNADAMRRSPSGVGERFLADYQLVGALRPPPVRPRFDRVIQITPLLTLDEAETFAEEGGLDDASRQRFLELVQDHGETLEHEWDVLFAGATRDDDTRLRIEWRGIRQGIDEMFLRDARELLTGTAVRASFDRRVAKNDATRVQRLAATISRLVHTWHLEDVLAEAQITIDPQIETLLNAYRKDLAEAVATFEDRLPDLHRAGDHIWGIPQDADPDDIRPWFVKWLDTAAILDRVNIDFIERVRDVLDDAEQERFTRAVYAHTYSGVFQQTPVEFLLERADELACFTPAERADLDEIAQSYSQRQHAMRLRLVRAIEQWESPAQILRRFDAAADAGQARLWTRWEAAKHPAIGLWMQDNTIVSQTLVQMRLTFPPERLAELPIDVRLTLESRPR